jgi:hypothetical protein
MLASADQTSTSLAFLERRHPQVLDLCPSTFRTRPAVWPPGSVGSGPSPIGRCRASRRTARQIDQRPWPVGPEQLAGSHFSDWSLLAHVVMFASSSFVAGRGFQSWSSVMWLVFMIKRTPGSTSRIDMGTVQLSQAWMPGDLINAYGLGALPPSLLIGQDSPAFAGLLGPLVRALLQFLSARLLVLDSSLTFQARLTSTSMASVISLWSDCPTCPPPRWG